MAKPANPFTSVASATGPMLIVIAAILWAVDGILRRSLYSLPAVTIVFFEHLVGAVLILPIALRQWRSQTLTARDWMIAVAVSGLSSLLGTVFFTAALLQVMYIPFSVVFLLQKLQPLFAISSARLLLGEQVTRRYLPWAGAALLAAYFVTFPGGRVNLETGSGTILAAMLAFGAAACWGIGTTLSRMLLLKVSDTVATGLRFGITSLLGLGAVVVMGQTASLVEVTPSQWLRFLMIALSTGMVALWIYYKGLKQTQAKVSTILELTFPLLAVVIDAILYKTWLQPTQYLAAGVLLFSMFQVARLNQLESDAAQNVQVRESTA